MKLISIVIIIGILLVVVAAIFLLIRSARNMAFNLVYTAPNPVATTPDSVGLENWEDVTFASDDLQLEGWFIPPADNANGATLIFVHGWQGNRTAQLKQAALLHQHGYGALLFDLRNSGSSQGNVSTWGYGEANDIKAAYDYLLSRSEVNPDKICLFGFSTGGAATARAAAQIPGIKVVIIESTYTALVDNLDNVVNLLGGRIPAYPPLVLWFMERESGLPLRDIRPIDDVAKIAPRPIMFIQGTDDVVVDQSHTQKLFEAASEPKKLYIAPNAGHGEVFSSNPEEFEKQVIPFLDTYLKE